MTTSPQTDPNFTFVLSGGGARGALQVGALYALLEAGYQPEMLVGVSIGAVNAAFLALNGFNRDSLDRLKAAWLESVEADLMPSNYIRLIWRAIVRQTSLNPAGRIRDIFIANGLTPELCFADLPRPRLVIVSADLNAAEPVLHGLSGEEKVLDALLVSTALPRWMMPVKEDGHYMMDGGVVSNLPVEPALRAGANQIIAMDLLDIRGTDGFGVPLPDFLDKLSSAPKKRQSALELELAEARGVPTFYIGLSVPSPAPMWDFSQTAQLIEQGYQIAVERLQEKDQLA